MLVFPSCFPSFLPRDLSLLPSRISSHPPPLFSLLWSHLLPSHLPPSSCLSSHSPFLFLALISPSFLLSCLFSSVSFLVLLAYSSYFSYSFNPFHFSSNFSLPLFISHVYIPFSVCRLYFSLLNLQTNTRRYEFTKETQPIVQRLIQNSTAWKITRISW